MKGTSMIYRGYDIRYNKTQGWVVFKGDELIGAQPSEEFAMKMIDNEIKKQKAKQHGDT